MARIFAITVASWCKVDTRRRK